MAAKLGGYLSKFLAVVFTSILAPVFVDLVVRDIHGESHKPDDAPSSVKAETPRSTTEVNPTITVCRKEALPSPSPTPRVEVVRVIAEGMGRTPSEALQNAFRTALFQVIADRVDGSTQACANPDLVDAILRDGSGLIVSWKELGAKKEWRRKGTLYHREIAVTVDGRRLADRLRVVPSSIQGR
jgi:hypothetical protein